MNAADVVYRARLYAGANFSTSLLPRKVVPWGASVKLTENCQARCVTCDYWKTHWKNDIGTDEAVKLLGDLADIGIRHLRFTGGEPLLRKDFFEVLGRADTRRFDDIGIQTNGLLLKRMSDQINDSAISDIRVSIDGLKQTNDEIRGIDGYFDLAMEGMRAMVGKRLFITLTLMGRNALELERIFGVAEDLNARIEFNLLDQDMPFFQNAVLTPLWPSSDERAKIVKFLRERMDFASYELDYISQYFSGAAPEPACTLGFWQLYVMSNGDVHTGCYPLPSVGNILRSELRDIVSSEEYRRRAIAMIRRQCPGCTCGYKASLTVNHPFAYLRRKVLGV